MKYCTYILECADGTLYVGITTDIVRRIKEHNTSNKGAKYTKTRRPVTLKYVDLFESRSKALKREYELKQLKRSEKLDLLAKSDVILSV